MSTIVFLIFPAHGHINPTLPVVRELILNGHRVIYYGSDELKAKIVHSGAEYKKYNLAGIAFDKYGILQNLFEFSAFLFKVALRICTCHLTEIAALKADCIVYDSLWAAGKIIAQKLNINHVSSVPILVCDEKEVLSAFTPLFIVRFFTRNIRHICTMLLYRMLIWLRTHILLNLFDVFLNKAPLNIVYTSAYFQPDAESFDESFCFVGPSISERSEIHDFPLEKLAGKKLVYVSFGTIINDKPEFYKNCIDLFKDSDFTVVVSIGRRIKAQDLPCIPANVIISNHVPQLKVLEKIQQDKSFAENACTISKTLRRAGGYKKAAVEILKFIENRGL